MKDAVRDKLKNDIVGVHVAPLQHEGGGAARTQEIPAPYILYGKEGVGEYKGGPPAPCSNGSDVGRRPPCVGPPMVK